MPKSRRKNFSLANVKHTREKKRQLGQFLTPVKIAQDIVGLHDFAKTDRVIEPGFGSGSFLIPIIEKFMQFYEGSAQERLSLILTNNVFGIEIDKDLYHETLETIVKLWGPLPQAHNLVCGDFLLEDYPIGNTLSKSASEIFDKGYFDHVIGNPPFGGTVNIEEQDKLERQFGARNGYKIKKESYSFFIVKALEILKQNGSLTFICSDTFLTIPTMMGLRRLLMDSGACRVYRLTSFSPETNYPMVILEVTKEGAADSVNIEGNLVKRSDIELTGNFSWRASPEFSKYFVGQTLGDFMFASSGMTTGKNEYFVRKIIDGAVYEPYEFSFFDDPIKVSHELSRARLNKLSPQQMEAFTAKENSGATRRNVKITKRQTPLEIKLPHLDYRPYNKATKSIVFAEPTHVIFWRNNGEAVLTYKANARWYLHGVGGAKYFFKEGLTWQLISSRLNARYLPPEYVLDSGAPCAFLRECVEKDELYFILGWVLTNKATKILKKVLNHTMNIQSKDFERLPYPFWVSSKQKIEAIDYVKGLIKTAKMGRNFSPNDVEVRALDQIYKYE